jgi:hypothetical protein
MEPTWQDHHDLNFWLWACLHDAEAFFEASHRSTAAMHEVSKDVVHNLGRNRAQLNAERLTAQARLQLSKYHFVLTTGSLVKNLTRLAPLFPTIQPLVDAAEHLKKEGLSLRNMIEHADTNFAAAKKGTPRGGFVRKSNLLPELPGTSGGTADATALIVDQDGHWLGGRLNVERVVAEVRRIYEAAQAIPPPTSLRP